MDNEYIYIKWCAGQNETIYSREYMQRSFLIYVRITSRFENLLIKETCIF
jgi:hypothetical protein